MSGFALEISQTDGEIAVRAMMGDTKAAFAVTGALTGARAFDCGIMLAYRA